MQILGEVRGMAGEEGEKEEEEVSGGVGLRGKGLTVVLALWSVFRVRVGVAVQVLWEMFVVAVKLVDRALRDFVQDVGVWLNYL